MQRRRLVRIIEEYALRKKMNIDVIDTAKVSELIQNIESESADQLYFLDIDIKNESKKGLEIAQEIRKLDNRGTIVFVTTHSEFAPITYKYKVSALDFIDKSDPEMIKRVEESIQYVYDNYDVSDDEDDFILVLPKRTIKLPYKDIYYFETIANHRIKLNSKNRILEFYGSLKEIEKMDDRLFRCHNSVVLNLNNVIEVSRQDNCVYFEAGISCPVARKYFRTLRTKLLNYSNFAHRF